jgi:uncharacterized membrane protein
LPWLFLIYALPASLFMAIAIPPLQVPDEENHAFRADQISRGTLFLYGGGYVGGALVELKRMASELHFRTEVKQTAEVSRRAAALGWSIPAENASFVNTAQYGPLFYLPQVFTIWIGKLFGLSVIWTMLLARLINGFIAVFIGFVSIRICRRAQAMVFTTLLLPETMSEFASLAQDALIISMSIFVGALGSRIAAEQRLARASEFGWFAFTVVATTMARPTQLALAAIGPVFVGWRDGARRRKLAIAIVALIALIWWTITLSNLIAPIDRGGFQIQLASMITRPLLVFQLLLQTFRETGFFILTTMIGRFGWVDTPLPDWYYYSAVAALVLAWLAPGNSRPYIVPAITGVLTVSLMLIGLAVALYASWTVVGKMTIDGLQGRYILPVLPLLGWAAPFYKPALARMLFPCWLAVMAFPLVWMVVAPGVIMERFYGSWSDMGQVLKILYLN